MLETIDSIEHSPERARDNWLRLYAKVQIMLMSDNQVKIYVEEIAQTSAVSNFSAVGPRTRKAFDYLCILGKFTIIIPWRWDPGSGRMKKLDPFHFKMWRAQACLHIFLRLCLLAYVFLSIAIRPIPAYEIFLVSWNLGIQMATMIFLVLVLIPHMEFELLSIVNASFRFNTLLNHCRFIHAKAKFSPGTENLMQALVLCGSVLVLCIGPGGGYMLSSGKWHITWILDYFQFIPFLYGFLGIYASYFYAMDATVIIWVALGTIMHCDIMSGWIEELKNEVTGESDVSAQNRKIQIIFRAHQVLHRYVEGFTYFFVPIILCIALVVCITVTYSVFGLYPVLNAIVLLCCAVLSVAIIILLKYLCNICGRFIIYSVAYRDSFDRIVDPNKSHIDALFFKSIEPITFHVGPYKEINNAMFQPIVTNVVVNWVINLLLSLEKPVK